MLILNTHVFDGADGVERHPRGTGNRAARLKRHMWNRQAKTYAGCRDSIRNRDGNLLNTARSIGLGITNTVAAAQVKLRQAKTVFLVHGVHKGKSRICRLLEALRLKNL